MRPLKPGREKPLCVIKSRPGEMAHAQGKIKYSLLAQEARCEERIQYPPGHLNLKIIWRGKFIELKMKRRPTDARLGKESG